MLLHHIVMHGIFQLIGDLHDASMSRGVCGHHFQRTGTAKEQWTGQRGHPITMAMGVGVPIWGGKISGSHGLKPHTQINCSGLQRHRRQVLHGRMGTQKRAIRFFPRYQKDYPPEALQQNVSFRCPTFIFLFSSSDLQRYAPKRRQRDTSRPQTCSPLHQHNYWASGARIRLIVDSAWNGHSPAPQPSACLDRGVMAQGEDAALITGLDLPLPRASACPSSLCCQNNAPATW